MKENEKERTERKEDKQQTTMKGVEKGKIESEGLREERNQGDDFDETESKSDRDARQLTRESGQRLRY